MENYKVLEVIGDGSFGTVIRALHNSSQEEVAIKKFKQSALNNKNGYILKTTVRELKCLKIFQSPAFAVQSLSARNNTDSALSSHTTNPHIVKFHESFLDEQGKLNIVMEFVPKSMLQIIEKYSLGMRPVKRVKGIIAQVLLALYSMHKLGIIHRDIKPENVLINDDNSEDVYERQFNGIGFVKLCDFGSVAFKEDYSPNTSTMTPYVATRWYRAPELIVGTKGGIYDERVDIWACGCLLAEMLDGRPLFPGDSDIDQLNKIQSLCGSLSSDQREMFQSNSTLKTKGDCDIYQAIGSLEVIFRRKLDGIGMDFLRGCLSVDPQKRFTALECLRHEWLTEVVEEFGWTIENIVGSLHISSLHGLDSSLNSFVEIPSENLVNLSPVDSQFAKLDRGFSKSSSSPIELSVLDRKSLEVSTVDDTGYHDEYQEFFPMKADSKLNDGGNHVFHATNHNTGDISNWNVFGSENKFSSMEKNSTGDKRKPSSNQLVGVKYVEGSSKWKEHMKTISKLESENTDLKKENYQLRSNNERLNAEIQKLKTRLEVQEKNGSKSGGCSTM